MSLEIYSSKQCKFGKNWYNGFRKDSESIVFHCLVTTALFEGEQTCQT
jgi:hypothetical protein